MRSMPDIFSSCIGLFGIKRETEPHEIKSTVRNHQHDGLEMTNVHSFQAGESAENYAAST